MKLRHVLEKISAWVDGSIKLGDSLASFDQSGHVALPWGVVKLLLAVREKIPIASRIPHWQDIYD